jgi:peptide/nickel transport system permease protein
VQNKEMNADSVLRFLILTEKISHATDPEFLRSLVNAPDWNTANLPAVSAAKYQNVKAALAQVFEFPALWKHWIPAIGFTTQNRFHFWLFGNKSGDASTFRTAGILNGDFGNSYISHRAVKTELWKPFKLTVLISTATVFLSLFLAIPLGGMLVLYKNTWFGKAAPAVMNFVYAIPLFFMATLLLEIFANPDVLAWFPVSGTGPISGTPEGLSGWQELWIRFPYFILPVISYFYGATIFFSRMLQAQLEQELDMDYIRTARAKGVSEFDIVFRHALKNSFFPILTVSLDALPLMFAGSILLESLFSLPGMAFTLLGAVQNQDHPVLIACFVLIGGTISVMYMLLDILYKVLDPRLQRSAKEVSHA